MTMNQKKCNYFKAQRKVELHEIGCQRHVPTDKSSAYTKKIKKLLTKGIVIWK